MGAPRKNANKKHAKASSKNKGKDKVGETKKLQAKAAKVSKSTAKARNGDDVFGTDLKTFSMDDLGSGDALSFYKKNQILHVRTSCGTTGKSGLDVLHELYQENPTAVERTWTVENAGENNGNLTPGWFFKLNDIDDAASNCYVSTILQDSQTTVNKFLSNFPFDRPPCTMKPKWSGFKHSLPLWVFIGRHIPNGNKNKGTGTGKSGSMNGRPEHTDSVSHDGTWHYQISGEKYWYVRPLESAIEWTRSGHMPKLDKEKGPSVRIKCKPGDVLMINTRLWWHYTELPYTNTAQNKVSMSFARDFYCEECALPGKEKETSGDSISTAPEGNDNDNENEDEKFTNVDGIYAKENVRKGQVVIRESELPNCSLPRSDDPNCEVGELEDGEGCLAALRDISAGEWLSVAPSDDESELSSDCEFISGSDDDED